MTIEELCKEFEQLEADWLGYAAERLSGNVVKEACCRSTAMGLRMILDKLSESPTEVAENKTSPWQTLTGTNLPQVDELVWLWDGQHIWIGGRCLTEDSGGWQWGSTLGRLWYTGTKWEGYLNTDNEYRPTHFLPLPIPPGWYL